MSHSSVFFEIHKDIPIEGPGNFESTKKAFLTLSDLSAKPIILDVGCGPGIQTIELTKLSNGDITALDLHQDFLDELNKKAVAANLKSQIKTVQGSMLEMPFDKNSFDLVWSEGAIYIIGFKKGLQEWKGLLKDNGYLAVTHLSWLKKDIPEEPLKFWSENYPDITSIDVNLEIGNKLGYQVVDHFILPESAWWDHYYNPQKNA